MGLWTVLLICLSQVELGRVWAHQHKDALTGKHLRTDVGPSSLHRTRRDQQNPHKHREARNIGGRGLDVSTLPGNTTHIMDSQQYYTWQSFGPTDRRSGDKWVDLNNLHKSQVQIHGILSNAHQKAARVALSFDFPFYGHHLRQIIIATGGFIFMGDVTHRMLTATQYIAPLMANFDPSFSKNSTVRYSDNGRLFVVQWDNVRLKDREAEGSFTFQAVLDSNGTVIFNYREVPIPVEQINSTEHPVKVGLSDAFLARLPSLQPSANQRTIYEYHRVEIDTEKIVSGSSFELTPLPTCLQHTSCELCVTSNLTAGCGWCNTLQRCSDGIDRHRQEWLDYNCPEEAKGTCEDYNPIPPEGSMSSFNQSSPGPTASSAADEEQHVTTDVQAGSPNVTGITENAAIIAGVVGALVLLVALTLLAVYYINTHPTVAPPFYLMQRRTNNYWPSMKFHNQGCQSSYAEVELGGHEKDGFIESEQCL
ncbi:plexin domain-containing protein 1 isoform X2 [Gasterosteus aculeatus]|uniref:plexin domain-containing protein 1-like isoform X2 n=1 Tax=Gasterosteus aculeatus aculeatus TaxID=481459 RepID=UPI001A98F22E|nr:plexin domain-containing protein 1-like isoform X2 [Gasterosteus aculeatus aculeatus]